MHDQRKVKEELDEKTRHFNEEKIRQFRTIYDDVFQHYRNNNLSRDVLGLLNVLLEVSPEQYTFFGYRRRILISSWVAAGSGAQQAGICSAAPEPTQGSEGCTLPTEGELSSAAAAAAALKLADLESEYVINTKVILKDYKVYSAFVHRRWIICEMPEAARRIELLRGELKKCDGLLKMDERNFHAWGYRRWVTGKLAEEGQYSDAQEWSFTESKIRDNFSNYSAWHNRGLLMVSLRRHLVTGEGSGATGPDVMGEEANTPVAAAAQQSVDAFYTTAKSEMDLAVRALYCDPNDQSAWLYAEFLLGLLRGCTAGAAAGDAADEAYAAVLALVVRSCDELLQEEEMPFALWMQSVILRSHAAPSPSPLPSDVADSIRRWGDLAALSTRLQSADAMRRGMYVDMVQS